MRSEGRSGLIDEARLVAVALIPVAAVSVFGQIADYPNLTLWYTGLAKASILPPEWVMSSWPA
jgi:benzodiazapine receptor